MRKIGWIGVGAIGILACSEGGKAASFLEVLSTSPPDGATNVPDTTSGISVVFSKDVRSDTLNGDTFRVSNLSPVRIAYDSATRTATYLAAGPLAAPATYTVVLTTGIRATDGATLREPFRFVFSTGALIDTTPPQIVDVQPLADARDVEVTTPIRVRFSESINDTSWAVGFRLTREGDTTPVRGSHSYSEAERTGIFTPAEPLAFSTVYRATVTQAVVDRSGNLLGAPFTWQFTTAPARDTTPPVVTATPPGGLYAAAPQVELSADEPASIFWTTQDPVAVPAPNEAYVSPIPIPANAVTRLRFRARDRVGNVSEERSERYVVDTLPPASSISPTQEVHNQVFNILLSASDNSSAFTGVPPPKVYYLIQTAPAPGTTCPEVGRAPGDATASVEYLQPFALPIQMGEEKEFRVCYRAIDAAGNREAVRAQRYVVDLAGVFTRASPPGGLYNAPVMVTLSAFKDAAHTMPDATAEIYFTTDNTPVAFVPANRYSSPIAVNTSTVLRFRGRDGAGNEETERTETYVIDTEPPSSTLTTTPAGPAQTATFRVTITVVDNLPGARAYYLLQENPTPASGCPEFEPTDVGVQAYDHAGPGFFYEVAANVEKTLRICYRAIDAAGNREAVRAASFLIDSKRPVTAISRPPGRYNAADCGLASVTDCATASCPLTLTSDDPAATIRYQVDTAPEQSCTGSCTVSLRHAARPQTLRVWSNDAAGNQEAPRSLEYDLDLCPPRAITDAAVTGRARLVFTAPGDDLAPPGNLLPVHGYEIARWNATETPTLTDADFVAHRVLATAPCPGDPPPAPPMQAAGAAQALTIPGVEPGAVYKIAVRALDGHCNRSAVTQVVTHTFVFDHSVVALGPSGSTAGSGLTALGNFNGDSNAETGLPVDDFAAGGGDPNVVWVFRGSPSGRFDIPQQLTLATGSRPGLASGNVLATSTRELVVSYVSGSLGGANVYQYLAAMNGYSPAPARTLLSSPCNVQNGAVYSGGDLDGDGLDEVVLAGENGACIYRSDNQGSLWPFQAGVGPLAAIVGNVSGDAGAKDDLVLAQGESVFLHLDLSTAPTSASATIPMGREVRAVGRAGDFDRDGIADFAVATVRGATRCSFSLCFDDYYPQITVFYGNAQNVWTSAAFEELTRTSFSQGTAVSILYRLDAGDIDGDGFGDVVLLEGYGLGTSGTWKIRVIYGGARGRPPRTSTFASTAGPTDVQGQTPGSMAVLGDVNGDGLKDVGVWFGGPPFGGSYLPQVLLLR